MHNYGRLKDLDLMQNYFQALSKLIGINPAAAYKGFQTVSLDATLTNCQNISQEWLLINDIPSQASLLNKLVIDAASKPDVDPNNVFEFLELTGQKHQVFGSLRSLHDLLETFDSLDDFDQSNYGLFYCDHCEELEWDYKSVHAYDDETICRACKDSDYEYSSYYDQYVNSSYACQALDEYGDSVTIHEDDDNFHWDDEEDCRVHYNYGGSSGELLGDYHDSKRHQHPISSDWTLANGNRYFGVELEIESKVDRHSKIQSIHDVVNLGNEVGTRCFFERDGSLTQGFEIVTQPMGLDLHSNFWSWLQKKELVQGLRSHNTNTCGLHVHVSRNVLQQLQLNKMITFVNHPDNAKLIQSIARRYDTNYAQIKVKTVSNATENCDRYDAININTTDRKTVEFRIFKGTLKYQSVMAAIQFVNSLTLFCSQDHFDLSTERFLEFISKQPDNEHLLPYINERMYGVTSQTTTV